MAWDVEYTDQFEEWWETLTLEQQNAVGAAVELLQEEGPGTGRPLVDSIVASRHAKYEGASAAW